MPTDSPLLAVEALSKRFGGVVALDGVDLTIRLGEVHGLVGENGAGKSTLIKCLSGVHEPNAGTMRLDEAPFSPDGPRDAERLGLRVIHQELNLVPGFSAIENIFVGRRYPKRLGLVDRSAMAQRVRAVAADLAPDLPLDRPIARLTTGQCQLVEILRALISEARLVIMDEPSASLSKGEADRLHGVVRRLRDAGTAVLFVSHRLDEIFALCDRVTVLRNGRTVATDTTSAMTRDDLVHLMSGGMAMPGRHRATRPPGPPVLRVDRLPFGRRRTPLSFAVHKGEVVALYGLIGAGRSRLLRTLWGVGEPTADQVTTDGGPLSKSGPAGRIRQGIAFAPEDRRTQGLVMRHSIAANATLPRLDSFRGRSWLPMPSAKRVGAFIADLRQRLDVRMGRSSDPIATLSGGNQQKLMVGRWTPFPIRLLLLDEPTRGVDVGAKAELHRVMRDLAAGGAGILMASSDLEEVLDIADRILVMADGRIVAELAGAETDGDQVLAALFATERQEPERKTA
ncbi:MAG: sugar ABC transporter ATP-binding protein [Pseudomonadota bacterium]